MTGRAANGAGTLEPDMLDLDAVAIGHEAATPYRREAPGAAGSLTAPATPYGREVPGAAGPVDFRPAAAGFQVAEPVAAQVAAAAPAAEPVDRSRPLSPLEAELIAATGAIVLVLSLLLLPWFGTASATGRFASRAATPGSEGAWHTLLVLRWLVLVAVALALLPLLIRPVSRWLGLPRRIDAAIALVGCLTALLLGFRVLIDLPDPNRVVDQEVGAILGLLGALLIALGGFESMRAHAAHARARQARDRSRRTTVPPGDLARVHV